MLGDQLKLPLPEESAGRRLPGRIRPMEAVAVDAPFDDPEYFFEPWWPGARALAFVEAGRLRMQVSGLSDPIAAFPELGDLPQQVIGEALVLDGTLLVLDDEGRPDAELLRARLTDGPAGERDAGRPAYVASDLLWSEGVSWSRRPFAARRARLTAVLPAGDRVIVGRGYVQEGTLLAHRFNLSRLETEGDPIPVVQKINLANWQSFFLFSASESGVLVTAPLFAPASRLVWVDRSGKENGAVGEAASFGSPRLSPDGRKVQGTIHWVSARHAIKAEVDKYEPLFMKPDPEIVPEGEDYKAHVNPVSLLVVQEAFLEPCLATATPGEHYQFERLGYFCVDKYSKPGALIFNRAVTLRDSWAKEQKK